MQISLDELEAQVLDLHGARLLPEHRITPVMLSWPMGFAWSSMVAQQTILNVCVKAGLKEDQLLCLEEPLPPDHRELATVATDDIILLHQLPVDASGAPDLPARDLVAGRFEALDDAFRMAGALRNVDKDVNLEESIDALEVTLGNDPPFAELAIVKLFMLMMATLSLAGSTMASPADVDTLLGTAQWFAQLARSLFSCFHGVYDFARQEPMDKCLRLP